MAKNQNQWINFYSEKMVHTNQTADGKEFRNVTIPCPQSKTGYATIAVNAGQVLPSTKKDGTVVAGCVNILLGSPEKERNVSIAKTKTGKYATVKMTNKAIAALVQANRKEYNAAKAEA